MDNRLITILTRIFKDVKSKEAYAAVLKECESYIPSKQDCEIIRTKKLIPEIEYVKGKIKNMDKVIIPELKKREAQLFNSNIEEHKEGEATPAEKISDIFDKKMLAERNRKIWGDVLNKYNRDRTTLITGDFHLNGTLLQGIVNAHSLKHASRIFLLACSEDAELNEYIDTLDSKAVLELANNIIDFEPLFLHEVEIKLIKKDFDIIRNSIELLTKVLKENITKLCDKESSAASNAEIVAKADEIISLAIVDKEEEEKLSLDQFISKVEVVINLATALNCENIKVTDPYAEKLVMEYQDNIVNRAKLSDSAASLKIFTSGDMVTAFKELNAYNDSLKAPKIMNAKRHNSFLNSAIVLYAAATVSSPKGSGDIEFLRRSLLSLFFYTRLVPNENFRTATLYTI